MLRMVSSMLHILSTVKEGFKKWVVRDGLHCELCDVLKTAAATTDGLHSGLLGTQHLVGFQILPRCSRSCQPVASCPLVALILKG